MVDFLVLILLILFVILNGFFVTAEFSLLRFPLPKITKFENNGGRREKKLNLIFKDLNLYISSLQIGITFSALTLGWFGVTFFIELIEDLLDVIRFDNSISPTLALIFAFFLMISLYSIVGKMAPKMISRPRVDSIVLNLAIPTYYYAKLVNPFAKSYHKVTYLLLKTLRFNPEQTDVQEAYSEEELKMIIAQSKAKGEIDESEHLMIERIFDFGDTTVKEILTPRYKIESFPKNVNIQQMIQKARKTGYSRFPVYEGDLDNILGFVHIKDVITVDIEDKNFVVDSILRKVAIVHEGMNLDALLKNMQTKRSQIAIIVDEYGSVEGLVTIEDVIEEIVGEIDDEFDEETTTLIELIDENTYLVNADIQLDQFNSSFDFDLILDDVVTLAGFILEHLDDLPEEGSKLVFNNYQFTILEMDGNRISKVQLEYPFTNNGPEKPSKNE
ncbi:MAG: Magnesium and cobalt efflux protein CorC [Candidatus Heimdallarchaeota archaeon LC_2]|nr:MAG: Magnesium and cobalt efflux protein CorC [Candidatus Heimdallarchaeota archaeon LC_2]